MRSGIERRLILAWVVVLLASCDKKPPVAPGADDLIVLAANAGVLSAASPSAVAISTSQIDVRWQDNATNETGFEISRSTTGETGAFSAHATTAANVTSYSDAGLVAERTYCYTVRAFRTTGRKTSYAEFSTTACATTPAQSPDPPPNPPSEPPPTAPSYARARASSSSAIVVAWRDNSTTESGFSVERSATATGPWTVIATVGANVQSMNDAGRASELQVCYRIVAFIAQSVSSPSNTSCTAPPAAPSSLAAATATPGVDLTWTDNSGFEDGYQIERSMDGVTFYPLAFAPPNTTSYHDATASSGATYWYRVWANNDGGSSNTSNIASAQGSCVQTSFTEVCDNSVDDDCDGMPDLADPDCSSIPWDCGFDHCPPGYVCGYDGFCVSHCHDGWQNADEGDIDCGGSCATKCQAGQQCGLHYDCASGNCSFGICQSSGGTP